MLSNYLKKQKNQYSCEIAKDISKVKTREISQERAVHEYGILRQTLEKNVRREEIMW